ncbi:LTA synthase family protein [Dokdonella soli]|uniref:Sulfatase N-terminal domain-containing protein n=1 Tax=Dokdonella soli TaxID=529810 RepID=A0ABN1IQF7_9GAMM
MIEAAWIGRTKVLAWNASGAVAAGTALVALVYALDPAFRPAHGAAGDVGLAALNALPVALFALFMLALTRRPFLACWCAMLLTALLYAVNNVKLQSLETPLLPSDFALIGQLVAGHGLLRRYVPTNPIDLWLYALAAVVTIVLIAMQLRVEMRARPRALLACGVLTVGASLIAGSMPWQALYSDERLDFQSWAPVETTDHAGLLASLLRYHWEFSGPLSEPNRAAAAILLERHPQPLNDTAPARNGAGDLPDIIVVQSESFFDPARLEGLNPAQVAPMLRELGARATHGDLWVPTYGGGTIRTEFEVLTGIGLRYFPHNQYPYYDLTSGGPPSLASALASHGYRTLGVHPNDATFWNRASAFKSLGFAGFDDDEAFGNAPHEGRYISDEALVDHILRRLDEGGSPTFIFAISMENHGPYDDSPGIDAHRRDAQPIPPGLPADAVRPLRNYLYHLGNADRSLGRLAEALGQRKRRSLLLFYGDHLPALPEVYRRLGFRDGAGETLQPVPYLLFDTAAHDEHVETTASFFLPSRLLAAAGIRDRYFEVLDAVRDETTFGPEYTPAEDAYLGALMQMRQRDEWPSAQVALPVAATHSGGVAVRENSP